MAADDRDDWRSDEKNEINLNEFTNVPHPAHSTKKTAPPPPPPRHNTRNVNSNDTYDPPPCQPEDTQMANTGSVMNISLDQDIQSKLAQSISRNKDSASYYDDYSYGNNDDADSGSESIRKGKDNVPYGEQYGQYQYGGELDEDLPDYEATKEYEANKIDIYTDLNKMKKTSNEEASMLLPLRYNLHESYLAPYIMILSQVPQFHNLILKHESLVFPYKPDWWNREKCAENLFFSTELQRLVAFLNGNSIRRFSSLYNVIKAFEKEVREETEGLYELIDVLTKIIINSFTSINYNFKEPLEKLLKSRAGVQTQNTDPSQDIYSIPFNEDDLRSNIYETIYHKLFENGSMRMQLTSLSDVMLFVFEDDTKTIRAGFTLDEKIYPQIYSTDYEDILFNVDKEIEDLKSRKSQLVEETFRLRAFRGTSVTHLLKTSTKHLKSIADKIGASEESRDIKQKEELPENDSNLNVISEHDKYAAAGQGIEMIASHVEETLKRKNEEIESINERMVLLQQSKYDIEKLLPEEFRESLEPWIIAGVVFNSAEFAYRQKKSEKWIAVSINMETCKDYQTSEIPYETIEEQVQEYTQSLLDEGMILFYVRQSVFYEGEFEPLNKGLQDFIDKDNARLEDQLSKLNGHTDDHNPFEDPV